MRRQTRASPGCGEGARRCRAQTRQHTQLQAPPPGLVTACSAFHDIVDQWRPMSSSEVVSTWPGGGLVSARMDGFGGSSDGKGPPTQVLRRLTRPTRQVLRRKRRKRMRRAGEEDDEGKEEYGRHLSMTNLACFPKAPCHVSRCSTLEDSWRWRFIRRRPCLSSRLSTSSSMAEAMDLTEFAPLLVSSACATSLRVSPRDLDGTFPLRGGGTLPEGVHGGEETARTKHG